MVVTTISCDAVILCCASCEAEVEVPSTTVGADCPACGDAMRVDRTCDAGFVFRHDNVLIRWSWSSTDQASTITTKLGERSTHQDSLIRRIVENKVGWRCDDERDFCPEHAQLGSRAARPTAQPVEGAGRIDALPKA